MLLPVLLALFHPLLTRVASATRSLPAGLQFDIVFPRNETYAPTQSFPIVLGVQNLDAVWPLDISVSLYAWSTNRRLSNKSDSWDYDSFSLGFDGFRDAVGSTPGKHFFYINAISLENGTADQYTIGWEVQIKNRCFANNTEQSQVNQLYGWTSSPDGYERRYLHFSTAPGAQIPDVEAAVSSCPEPDENTSAVVRVTDMKSTRSTGEPCPVLETNITASKCPYEPAAKELAANVSAVMLKSMGCNEGTWQTITAPCSAKNVAPSLGVNLRIVGVLALALAILNLM